MTPTLSEVNRFSYVYQEGLFWQVAELIGEDYSLNENVEWRRDVALSIP